MMEGQSWFIETVRVKVSRSCMRVCEAHLPVESSASVHVLTVLSLLLDIDSTDICSCNLLALLVFMSKNKNDVSALSIDS